MSCEVAANKAAWALSEQDSKFKFLILFLIRKNIRGGTDRVSTPSPSSMGTILTSLAISPQMLTALPR